MSRVIAGAPLKTLAHAHTERQSWSLGTAQWWHANEACLRRAQVGLLAFIPTPGKLNFPSTSCALFSCPTNHRTRDTPFGYLNSFTPKHHDTSHGKAAHFIILGRRALGTCTKVDCAHEQKCTDKFEVEERSEKKVFAHISNCGKLRVNSVN